MQGILIEQDAARTSATTSSTAGRARSCSRPASPAVSAVTRGNRSVSNGAPFWISVRAPATSGCCSILRRPILAQLRSFRSRCRWPRPVVRRQRSTGTAPAVNARVEYFLDTASPLVRKDGALAGATLTTSVTGQGSVAIDPQKSQFSCGEQVTLTANPAWAGGSMPGAATWKERSPPRPWSWSGAKRHAEFVEDVLQPLAISGVTVTASADSASVNWTTNYPATSR